MLSSLQLDQFQTPRNDEVDKVQQPFQFYFSKHMRIVVDCLTLIYEFEAGEFRGESRIKHEHWERWWFRIVMSVNDDQGLQVLESCVC